VRQDARDPVAQVQGVAAEKVDEMGRLDRERVARIVHEHAVEPGAAGVPVPVHQPASRAHQPALAGMGTGHQGLRRGDAHTREVRETPLGHGHQHRRPECVTQDEVRRRRQGLLDGGDRIADVALVLAQGLLVEVQGRRVGAGDRHASGVVCHRSPRRPLVV
jgi:hypothetical protein